MTRSAEQDRLDDLLAKTSRTFALSIPALPEPTRREVTVAYLLFRIADTLEDATDWSPERQQGELQRFGRLLDRPSPTEARTLAADWTANPPLQHAGYLELLADAPAVVVAFDELTGQARELVRAHTIRTVDCMVSYVGRYDSRRNLELRDVDDLRAYCYAVAGIVGEMLTELFLLGRENLQSVAAGLRRHAARFGEALQLVNILKDSASDANEGRRYLPGRVGRDEVFALAREDLIAAREYVRTLQQNDAPRGVVEFTALPVLLAWKTLDRVEEHGPSSKLTRPEVVAIVHALGDALDHGRPAVP